MVTAQTTLKESAEQKRAKTRQQLQLPTQKLHQLELPDSSKPRKKFWPNLKILKQPLVLQHILSMSTFSQTQPPLVSTTEFGQA